MLKRNMKLSEFRWVSLFVTMLMFIGCDRGATEQVQAAQKFADAVVRNDIGVRDSMIATRIFKKYFENPYVASDYIGWMRSIYDVHNNKFFSTSRVDVDRDLKQDLSVGLLSSDEIEETGMVRIKSPNEGEQSAYFWMVKQKGHHWAVAIVTKGEAAVDFR
jgi:hypothetical protein